MCHCKIFLQSWFKNTRVACSQHTMCKTSCVVPSSQGHSCSERDPYCRLCLLKCRYHTLVCWCGSTQQVGLLFLPTPVRLIIENSARQDSRVSTAKIFTATLPKQVRVRIWDESIWNQIFIHYLEEARQLSPKSSGAVCTLTLFEVTFHSSLLSPLPQLWGYTQVLGKLRHMWAMHTSTSQTGSLKQSWHPIPVYNQQGFGTVRSL